MRPALLLVLTLATPLRAEPAPPQVAPEVASLTAGVFCALHAMDQRPAPGTLSGWIHVPDGPIDFHWPDTRIVPAQIGLAFGVRSRLQPGIFRDGEMRVFRPGSTTPETWESGFSDTGEQIAFFRFDREDELLPGLWRFEAWADGERLYAIAFEVVPAAALPDMAQACGAIS
ncbi:DUF3859 domain-containing protein [Rhodobacter calidifons]|uniref:DUF3859 domain-containing protein n=1 Tax=Rhodobacter calidifons TaxID=2715277 RepID=A0ABX0G5W4_9RHOB|nr:DUF3859 domain-containing protein [Rhodobacter calidifons]NHB76171.1 DUF3859 domain-containing protein [Rhodobacter calidifons]